MQPAVRWMQTYIIRSNPRPSLSKPRYSSKKRIVSEQKHQYNSPITHNFLKKGFPIFASTQRSQSRNSQRYSLSLECTLLVNQYLLLGFEFVDRFHRLHDLLSCIVAWCSIAIPMFSLFCMLMSFKANPDGLVGRYSDRHSGGSVN